MNYKNIDYDKVEGNCKDLVKFFNSVGLKTYESCEGHTDERKHKVWVSFDTSEDVVLDFIGRLKLYRDRMDENGRDNSIKHRLNGYFAKIYPFYTFETEDKMAIDKHEESYIPHWYYVCDRSTDYKKNRQYAKEDLRFFERCFEEAEENR